MALYKKHLKNRPNTSALNIWKGLLLTSLQISFKPASDSRFKKELFCFYKRMQWNYLSIPKLQWHSCWRLGMDRLSYHTLYWSDFLSIVGLKLIHVNNRGPEYCFIYLKIHKKDRRVYQDEYDTSSSAISTNTKLTIIMYPWMGPVVFIPTEYLS